MMRHNSFQDLLKAFNLDAMVVYRNPILLVQLNLMFIVQPINFEKDQQIPNGSWDLSLFVKGFIT